MPEPQPSDPPTDPPAASPADPVARRVSLAEATRVWARIGLLSFGGPAGQIALMHRELVERRRWLGEARFLHALNYCMLLPGPEATQLATYIGWLMHRTAGGVIAGALFVLPGALLMLLLSALYVALQGLPALGAALFGLKAAVLAIVIEALVRIGRRALRTPAAYAVAAAAFVAIFFFALPFPLIVLGAGLCGLAAARLDPAGLGAPPPDRAADEAPSLLDGMLDRGELAHALPRRGRSLRVLGACLLLWAAPLALIAATLGPASVYVQEGVFFSQAAVVTFGGAYAVLAYVAQRAVEVYGWMRPGEMLDGLGLAETTPGPLILVVQFVAFLGAAHAAPARAGGLPPLLGGALGAAVTLWVTFVPCFLWIFLGAPYIERLRRSRALHGALSAITASVVGVILNLSIYLGVHTLFGRVDERRVGPLQLLVPAWGTLDPAALGLALLSALLLLRLRAGVAGTLGVSVALGLAWRLMLR